MALKVPATLGGLYSQRLIADEYPLSDTRGMHHI